MFEASRVLQEEEQTSSEMDQLRLTVERLKSAVESSNAAFNKMRDLMNDEDATPEETMYLINKAIDANNAALGSE